MGGTNTDAPGVPHSYTGYAKEGAEFTLDIVGKFDAESSSFVGGFNVYQMPSTVAPVNAEKDDITHRKRCDPIPYTVDNADVLIAGTSGIICSAKVIHQCMPLGTIGHA
jgi:hypothetical protein